MSKTKIAFLGTKVFKRVSYNKESILDVQTHHYKPTEPFGARTRREERIQKGRSAQASNG